MTPLERQLFAAVSAGDLTAVRAALAAGADVNAIDYTAETGWAGDDAVEVATHLGHADIVRELIAAGSRNRSFIDTAIGERHPEVVRAWLESIGNERLRHLNGGDEEGVTPLMLAAHVGSPAVVRLLLEAGADPTLEDDDGDTALARAERGREEALWTSPARAAPYSEVADLLRAALAAR